MRRTAAACNRRCNGLYIESKHFIQKASTRMDLKDHIRGIPDFPKPGILFYDISTLLRDADAWQVAMGRMARSVAAWRPDLIAGIESRGFLMAAPLALKLGCGFIMIRKRGKLPGPTIGLNYALEYGEDRVEVDPARIIVTDVPGNAGWYKVDMQVRPHFKYMGAFFTLSLVGKLDKE